MNEGEKVYKSESTSTSKFKGELNIGGELKTKFNVPFLSRLKFLFTGKIDVSYLRQKDSLTSITSTEISEFEKLKSRLTKMKSIQINDVQNSSTVLRMAGGYFRMIKGGIDDLDTREFKNVMDNYDGYDTYRIDDKRYVRFNNTAFVSNYKRNDLLTTNMTLYCIPVGEFEKERFDFLKYINEMENLFSTKTQTGDTLAEIYPSHIQYESKATINEFKQEDTVKLFDVVYACIDEEN